MGILAGGCHCTSFSVKKKSHFKFGSLFSQSKIPVVVSVLGVSVGTLEGTCSRLGVKGSWEPAEDTQLVA